MDVNEILIARKQLNKDIWVLLNDFEKTTGMEVSCVDLTKHKVKFGREIVGGVGVELQLSIYLNPIPDDSFNR